MRACTRAQSHTDREAAREAKRDAEDQRGGDVERYKGLDEKKENKLKRAEPPPKPPREKTTKLLNHQQLLASCNVHLSDAEKSAHHCHSQTKLIYEAKTLN